MKMKNIIHLSLLFLIITFYSCENPIESEKNKFERNLTNASNLIIKISLERSLINPDSIYSMIEAKITDKSDFESIIIENVSLKVNGINLKALDSLPIYKLDDKTFEVKQNTLYEFEVELSNGDKYSTSIKTQNKNPSFTSIPLSQERGKDLIVQWDLSSVQDLLHLDFSYVNVIGIQTTLYNLMNISSGELTIPSDSFGWLTDSTKTLHLKLESKNITHFNNFDPSSDVVSEFNSEEKIINLIP
jgi:hypothetical protein